MSYAQQKIASRVAEMKSESAAMSPLDREKAHRSQQQLTSFVRERQARSQARTLEQSHSQGAAR